MAIFTISFNQFIEASKATEKGKARIVRNQINVNKLLTPWYQLAKNRIRIYFKDVQNFVILKNAIRDLLNKVPKDEKAKKNAKVSVEAVNKVIDMRFNNILVHNYEVLKVDDKAIEIDSINININPDIVFRYIEDGINKIGALKFHVSKSTPFDFSQCQNIANLLKLFLEEKILKEGEIVDERLCWAYDVFTDRLVHAQKDVSLTFKMIKQLCEDLKKIYNSI